MSEKLKPEQRVRQVLEGIRTKLFLRFGEKKSKWIFRASIAAIAVLIVLVVAVFLVRINRIEVTGAVTMFNEGEIIAAAGINEGDGLLWKPSWTIRKNVEKNMPMTHNVRVTKSPFGKVTIYVELRPVEYYFEYEGSYYAMDSELRVRDMSDSYRKYSAYGAVKVVLPEIRKPVVGERIVFYYTVEETDTEGETLYEVEDEKSYRYVSSFLSALYGSGYREDADGVILTERFDVIMIYANKFKVRFGESEDLDVKFRMLYEIFKEGSLQYADKVYIDLSDPSAAVARPDTSLDFTEFDD